MRISPILYLTFLLGSISFSFAAGKKTVVKGVVNGYAKETVTLNYQSYAIPFEEQKVDIELAADGSFSFELKLKAPVRGFIVLGSSAVEEWFTLTKGDGIDTTISTNTNRSQMVYFYLSPGDRQEMQVDATDVASTLKIHGKGSANSIYLNQEDWKFNSYKDKHLKNYFAYVHYSPQQYLNYVEERRKERTLFLKGFEASHQVSKVLVHTAENTIYGDAVTARLLYPRMRESYRDTPYTAPTDYHDFLKEVSLDSRKIDKGIAYFYFLDYYLKESARIANYTGEVYTFAETKISGRLLYEYYAFALRSNFTKQLYAKFGKDSPFPALAKRVRKAYSKYEGMLEGNSAPAVQFEDQQKTVFTWDKWRGKYVYVDFWATWCGPCIDEIPSLEKLQDEYADKNIVFLSISFDREADRPKWIKFVEDKEMKGQQLWIDEANKKILSQQLNISQIPRFLLLDPAGNIVNANAPRPSSTQIVKVFEEILKK